MTTTPLTGTRPSNGCRTEYPRSQSFVHLIPAGMVAGIAGTLAMDGASPLLARVLKTERSGPQNLGRWIGNMRSGTFAHEDLGAAAPVPRESLIGVATHYAIGATLGAGYVLLVGRRDRPGSLLRAASYGVVTTGFSWFAMFPAWGLGVLAHRGAPRQWALSLGNHAVFGVALGLALRRSQKH